MYGRRQSRGVRAGELHEGEAVSVAGVLSVCRKVIVRCFMDKAAFFREKRTACPSGDGRFVLYTGAA